MKISHLLTRKADTFSFFNDLHVHYGRCPFIKFKPKNISLTTEFTDFFYFIILIIGLYNVFLIIMTFYPYSLWQMLFLEINHVF